ncbi:hypothetical protein [Paracoccus sp. S-4012]|uniref:alginate O-acetyltransferase AlgX-related protein n=1 Tax=Paracoccus sp. S-4012 TaxID=2665648 RepID=UPI00351B1196
MADALRARLGGAARDAGHPAFAIPLPGPARIENVVLHGRDGWLFLWTGTNDVHQLYTTPHAFGTDAADGWVALLGARRRRFEAMGAQYRHLIAPDKLSIFPEHVPAAMPYFGRHPALQLARRLQGDPILVDVLEPLRGSLATVAARRQAALEGDVPDTGEPLLYYRTDSHWTFEGALVAFRALCASLGVTPPPLEERGHRGVRPMAFDLGRKLDPQVTELPRFPRLLRDAARIAANAQAEDNDRGVLPLKLVGTHVAFRNDSPAADPRRVVLFGDSFSEYRPVGLTGMLAETFREVHFVWSTNCDTGFIDALRPDIVVTEIAERFMTRLPGDDYTVPA